MIGSPEKYTHLHVGAIFRISGPENLRLNESRGQMSMSSSSVITQYLTLINTTLSWHRHRACFLFSSQRYRGGVELLFYGKPLLCKIMSNPLTSFLIPGLVRLSCQVKANLIDRVSLIVSFVSGNVLHFFHKHTSS